MTECLIHIFHGCRRMKSSLRMGGYNLGIDAGPGSKVVFMSSRRKVSEAAEASRIQRQMAQEVCWIPG